MRTRNAEIKCAVVASFVVLILTTVGLSAPFRIGSGGVASGGLSKNFSSFDGSQAEVRRPAKKGNFFVRVFKAPFKATKFIGKKVGRSVRRIFRPRKRTGYGRQRSRARRRQRPF